MPPIQRFSLNHYSMLANDTLINIQDIFIYVVAVAYFTSVQDPVRAAPDRVSTKSDTKKAPLGVLFRLFVYESCAFAVWAFWNLNLETR